MIKQKREQIKPALIMCSVLGVIIIVMFIAANSVNRNVVRDMKGEVLFYCDGIKLYDFDNDKLSEIARSSCFDGKFTGDGKIVYADGESNGFSIYDPAENKVLQTVSIEKGRIKGLTYSPENKTVLLIICDDDRYLINAYSGDDFSDVRTIADSEYEICGLDVCDGGDVYYTVYDGNAGILESVGIMGKTPVKELQSDGERLTAPCAVKDFVYICENKSTDSEIVKYSKKLGKATVPKFNSDEYNCTSIVTVSDEEYITSCDKDGKWGLYVCNGSNIVLIDNITCDDDLIKVTDYNNK